jgi:hypothetical protein
MNILNDRRNSFYSNRIIHAGKSVTKKIITRLISKKLIFVLGCQRSGTTLLYMLISSHPLVNGNNEDEVNYSFPSLNLTLHHAKRGKYICYKLPTKTPELKIIQNEYKHSKIFWIVRHPYSVISSMRSLIMPRTGKNWLITIGGMELKRHAVMFPEIVDIDVENLDEISLGAYIYKYKVLTFQKYEERGLNIFLVKFEDLVNDVKETLGPVLMHIGLGWSDSILSHHKKHEGKRYVGKNIGSRPVDKSRVNPKLNLNLEEMEKIKTICGVHMQKYYPNC